MTTQCSVSGCNERHRANGFCNKHHLRNKRHGSPTAGGTYVGDPTKFFFAALAYAGEDCVIWPFSRKKGYAIITVNPDTGENGSFYASRLICERVHGPSATPLMDAAHSCGNGYGGCISAKHVRWATRAENIADMKIHGTVYCGEKVRSAKLKDLDIKAIRVAHPHASARSLAKRFGVSQSTISLVVNRKRWKHVV